MNGDEILEKTVSSGGTGGKREEERRCLWHKPANQFARQATSLSASLFRSSVRGEREKSV
jgi:hypothetical protein